MREIFLVVDEEKRRARKCLKVEIISEIDSGKSGIHCGQSGVIICDFIYFIATYFAIVVEVIKREI
jgi:hypothetical protein